MNNLLKLLANKLVTIVIYLTISTLLILATFVFYVSLTMPSKKASVVETAVQLPKVCNEKDTLARSKGCSVLIKTSTGHGTGFIFDLSGNIVTNNHVLLDSQDGKIDIYYQGDQYTGEIYGINESLDLALVKASSLKDFIYCNWASSDALDLAENVYAVGWPNSPNGDSTITKGIFSRFVYFDDSVKMIQTDTPINPGNSGGPLLNECGVVGINTSKVSWINEEAPSEGIGYAISSDVAQVQLQEMILNQKGPISEPIKVLKIDTSSVQSKTYGNEVVSYDFEEVLFWESRIKHDKEILSDWKDAMDTNLVSSDKLSVLLNKLDRMVYVASELWDGYTNSNVSYNEANAYIKEYWSLNSETSDLSKELNYEGSIKSYALCIKSWEDLEKEYALDLSEQIKDCEEYLE